ncbi:Serine/threonine-protein kinase-like protein [Morus notabilis]|uniref:Serine/threonine-protein kinase-like protein n=2 Tax=Morus notabilis TaxID=981085 RepID=W9QK91_9ROSA|nr:Serine/threonine-protein kinase-like protein [Morus notabilis]
MIEFDYDELVKATESFSPSTLIGKGSHGSVYKAKLTTNDNNKLVAVKKPFLHAHEEEDHDRSKLQNEIRVLSFLRQNRHVIDFLGTSRGNGNNRQQQQQVLVMEYMPNGSLHDLLHVSETPPSWPKRLEIAVQVARAVRFLHDESQPSVVHRDIKSANVLFDCDFVAKLADFGLAVLVHVDNPGQPAGTIGYLDPWYTKPRLIFGGRGLNGYAKISASPYVTIQGWYAVI